MVVCLKRRRINFPVNARRNREFRRHPPGITHKQTEALGPGINFGGGIELCRGCIHLLKQEAGDRATTDRTGVTGLCCLEVKISGLPSQEDSRVLSKSHLATEGYRVLASCHGHSVVDDVGGRQPRLNIRITGSRAELREVVAERYHRRIFVARYAWNLWQLVGE